MNSARIEDLYRAHGPAILGYLRRMTGDPEAAADLVQETFATAIQFPDRLARANSARGWLFAVARNLGLRSLHRRPEARAFPHDPPQHVEQEDPRLEKMRQAIASLPATLRETLQLRIEQELSYQEISGVLGIPVGTVRSRIHDAVRQLRRRIAEARE